MSVEDLDRVDFVSLSAAQDTVKLTISDHLDWEDPKQHLGILQEKIYRYVDFVESGELWRTYPKAIGRTTVVIQIRLAHPPVGSAEDFFRQIGSYLAQGGIKLDIVGPIAS